ncbi:MAG TPA: DNA-directed RNA polymerase subunit alpha [Thermoanaerobaculaceae bacterium]|nr:DNA-directed RNA polymerase subunit alpha [Thermoanaerobaculaceae bacterium]HRS17331.1 DNA-directed RNA polymerase subunit alpha [Thermoanaerobaculaceae bacterium]
MRGLELHRPQAVVAEADPDNPNHGVFVAQPFERGWGVTIGNALRRILLSSIEGAAVVAVRFAGVDHEYDSIPGVMEDVTDFILNLKRVPLRLKGPESLTATLKASEPGELLSRAIDGGSELEVVDPSVYLAMLSEEGAVDAELVVRRGRGFVPADEQERRDLGVGFIFLDAAFSPVRKANFRIEPARVGQATDYEKLVLEVWTNGTITPVAAVSEAARLLSDHLPIFVNLEGVQEVVAAPAQDSALDRSIDELQLGVRILNMLRAAGIAAVRDLVAYSEDELQKLPGLGKKAVAEVRDRLERFGLSLGMRFDLPQS